jgi:hypothetical protein
MLRCEQSSGVQRFGTVNRPLRPPFTGARRNMPLPTPLRGAILGSKSEGSGECRFYWIHNPILAALAWHGIWQFKVQLIQRETWVKRPKGARTLSRMSVYAPLAPR